MLSLSRDDDCRSASKRSFVWGLRWSVFATVVFVLTAGVQAWAAPRDKAALKKIDEALTVHYLNMDFDAAEGTLIGTIRACEDKCSGQVIAKAWMYVGIVKGAGRNDMAAAKDAFNKAVAADPNVQLDEQVAPDPVKALFAKVKGGGGGGGEVAPPPPPIGKGGGFTCTPAGGSEVETRRPIPVSCEADVDLKSAKLHYKAFGGSWTTIKMEPNAGVYRATIPCAATQSTGKLRFYAEGVDADNDVAAKGGTKDSPQVIEIVSETSAEPPAFPDEEPPARCGVETMEQGGAGGNCGSWGAKCGPNGCCDSGLACSNGTCDASECESDNDCKNGGTCEKGKCVGGEGEGAAAGPYKKNWIGVDFGLDIAMISSDSACARQSRDDHFACFLANGSTYEGVPNPSGAGSVSFGATPATIPIMLTFEHLFGTIGVQARVGYALNGGMQPKGGTAFFPIHAELRGKYWVRGTSAFSQKGVRPWVHLGGGMAQVDAVIGGVDIADCGPGTIGGSPYPYSQTCVDSPKPALAPPGARPQGNQAVKRTVTAQKQLGNMFVTLGGGLMYAIGPNHGPVFNLNFMVPLPSTGFVVEPTLGYEFGF